MCNVLTLIFRICWNVAASLVCYSVNRLSCESDALLCNDLFIVLYIPDTCIYHIAAESW